MHDQPVKPERITKPIQLLGAWLAGLLAIDSCFLFAASNLPITSWHAGALVAAAIVNVPLFLAAVFLLQTRFRPELQEDSYYSTYLSSKTNEVIKVARTDTTLVELRHQIAALETKVPVDTGRVDAPENPISLLKIGVNKHLSDKAQVQAKLASIGVLGVSVFGAEDPPQGRNVAMAGSLSPEIKRRIVELARDLGFTTYNTIDNPGEDIEEDILFGSYGRPEFEIIRSGA